MVRVKNSTNSDNANMAIPGPGKGRMLFTMSKHRFTTGFTAAFKGLKACTPPNPSKICSVLVAKYSNTWVDSSNGSSTTTERRLNRSWRMAPLKARSNSLLREMCPNDTSVLVTDVPIFAPMTIGIADRKGTTPAATIPTKIEVVKDELWTKLVVRMPTNNPMNGFAVVEISTSANPRPNNLNPAPIPSMAKKNRYNRQRIFPIVIAARYRPMKILPVECFMNG